MGNSKIKMGYDIDHPPPLIYPSDKLSGKIILVNIGKKVKTLKKVFIRLVSSYQCHERDSDSGTLFAKWVWVSHKETLAKYYVDHPKSINAGEKTDLSFAFQFPSKWKPRVGKRYRNWQVVLLFLFKTGLKSIEGATCILPVKGSDIPPSSIFLRATLPGRTICPNCGLENLNTAKFCEKCGSKLLEGNLCKSCGNEVSKEATFCPFCGAQIFESSPHQ